MSIESHWENIYGCKAAHEVSWFRPHLETSLKLIERAATDFSASIIDVGGGESTLVDDLLAKGYSSVSVLDISATAIDATKARLGKLAARVHWIVADVTQAKSPENAYDIWHDRAVFHFLMTASARAAYVQRMIKSIKRGGHVVIATFGPEGPAKCSGLDVQRYDADSLRREFGSSFRLVESSSELHQTPFGTTQQFLYCLFAAE